jgi:osmotically-inducible protein OsmY
MLSGCTTEYQRSVAQQAEADRIKSTIESRILTEKELKNTSITVKTFKHNVQLSGYVHTDAQQLLAVQIAMDVEKVEYVNNALILKKMVKKHKKHKLS